MKEALIMILNLTLGVAGIFGVVYLGFFVVEGLQDRHIQEDFTYICQQNGYKGYNNRNSDYSSLACIGEDNQLYYIPREE